MIVTVFRARLRDDARDAYMALAPKIAELARNMPGYLSHKIFTAEDGERVTIVEFKDEESQKAWATQVDHVAAKKMGRSSFYAEYAIQVCQVLRESKFVSPQPDPDA
jgi:heme-degrading monooxygenase HmoA